MKSVRFSHIIILIVLIASVTAIYKLLQPKQGKETALLVKADSAKTTAPKNDWEPPDTSSISHDEQGELIRYGRELIANTAYYLGPKGKVADVSNGMNCQNCHIDAGSKPYGNCFSAVASTYPTFRPRSGIIESIEFRVNDCLQRSLNGKTIDSTSKEMRAMVAYLKWLGKGVPKGVKPKGANTEELSFLDRAADTAKGRIVYETKCVTCHGKKGEGMLKPDSIAYLYPPLWGPHSYNNGAGLYRLTRFAGYVKNNMPFGTSTHDKPQLTNEEAWDVAAFVNSQPRPTKKFPKDWPNIALKAIDYPYGPYKDSFSQQQHKYGPFGPIKKARDEASAKKAVVSK
jgi:thiosulfate dehydrogenase